MTVPDRRRTWRKASRSTNTDNCVEVALDEAVGVRDSKAPDDGELDVTGDTWRAFTDALRS